MELKPLRLTVALVDLCEHLEALVEIQAVLRLRHDKTERFADLDGFFQEF